MFKTNKTKTFYLKVFYQFITVQGEITAAFALLDIITVGGDVVTILLHIIALEVTLRALHFLQLPI